MKGIPLKKIIKLSLTMILCVGSTTWAAEVLPNADLYARIDDLEREWAKVYVKDEPMLASVMNNYLAQGKIFSGSNTLTGSSPAKPGEPELKVSFPVKSFEATDLKAFLNAQARLGLMRTLLTNYVGIQHDNYKELEKKDAQGKLITPTVAETQDAVNKRERRIKHMTNRLNLETFVMHMASFALADNMGQRCSSWRLAGVVADRMDLATLKDLDIDNGGGTSWSNYLATAQGFFKSSFLNISPSLCELNTVNSRSDTMNQIQQGIDAEITQSMGQALSAFNALLQNQITNVGTTLANSEIPMPAGELFELERTFRDLTELLKLVQCDSLALYSTSQQLQKCGTKGSNSAGENKALLARIDENIKKMSTSDVEDVARANLKTYEVFFGRILDQLAAVPNSTGLTADQKKSLKTCELVKAVPAATAPLQDFANFQKNYDSCLNSLLTVYTDLKKEWKDEPPLTLSFARELGSLAYQMSLVNSQIKVSK